MAIDNNNDILRYETFSIVFTSSDCLDRLYFVVEATYVSPPPPFITKIELHINGI